MPPKTKKTTAPKHRRGWDRRSATGAALADFQTAFAKDMGVELEKRSGKNLQVIPTGSLDLDVALGIGGWRAGRIHEIWGAEHMGKTSLSILSCIEALKASPDQMVGWIDMEQTFDDPWAEKLGLDLSKVMFHTPIDAEDTADAVKRMVMSGMCSFVVLDSIGGMISRAEMEKESDEAVVANVAKIVTRMVKQVSPVATANGTTVLVVNQVRSIIGAMKGPDTHTAGGWALKHVTTSRVRLSGGGEAPRQVRMNGEDIPVSKYVAAKVEKNKSAAMGYKGKFWLTNVATAKHGPIGIDQPAEAVSVGRKVGLIKGTTWLTLPNGEKFQGKEKTADYLRDNPEEMASLRALILASVRDRVDVETEDGSGDMEEFLEAETK